MALAAGGGFRKKEGGQSNKQLKDVVDYCWTHNFLDVFHNFFDEHAVTFEGAPLTMATGEHNLDYYNLFQIYLKLYESTLTNYLESIDFAPEDFYEEIAALQEDENIDQQMKVFINCLLASADYESFYKVMAKQGNQRVLRKSINADILKKLGGRPIKAEAKAEGKDEAEDEKPSAKSESKGSHK